MQIPTGEGFVVLVEGQLYKKIVTEGGGELPQKGQEVSALYKGTLINGDVFDSNESKENPFKFVIGQGQVIKGWDEGFASMKRGEKAILQIGPDYAYGKSGSGKIPANATLIFEVELLDFQDKNKEKWELSDEEKLTQAKQLKQQATQAFKKGDFATANTLYADSASQIEDVETEQAAALNLLTWSNLALVNNKLKQYGKAIQNANKVVKKDPHNIKALFRRGVAQLGNQNFEAAKADFNEVLLIDPNNNETKSELAKVKSLVQKSKKREKNVYSKIFGSNYYEDMKIEPPKAKAQSKEVDSEGEDEELEVEKPEQKTTTEMLEQNISTEKPVQKTKVKPEQEPMHDPTK